MSHRRVADLYGGPSQRLSTNPRAPKRTPVPKRGLVGGKSTPVYLAHSYPTKIPPEAIQPLIEHFTRPGDVICDPFAGSGMTGVAAVRSGRHAHLSDISPLSRHIAWNVTHPCDAEALSNAANSILHSVQSEMDYWYQTRCTSCGGQARLEWLLWADTVFCPQCQRPVRLWDAGFDRTTGKMPGSLTCPICAGSFQKRAASFVESSPVWASVVCRGACGRMERPALYSEVPPSKGVADQPPEDWFPEMRIDPHREMYVRSALHLRGIKAVADFYTARNLRALARLWDRILEWPDLRVRRALALAFTNTAWHGTRMRRYNARGGQRPLTGTLYIPQMSIEVNVATVFQHKIGQIARFFAAEPEPLADASVRVASACRLSHIDDASIDYVFTDPPFGSNIFYADCNLIAESWLNDTTDTEEEAVVNRSRRQQNGGKSVQHYAARMSSAFGEIARVLKPGAYATVVFQNTDPEIWMALQDAVTDSGMRFSEASTLDKTQQSHKGYKGRAGRENVAAFDVVLHLRRAAQFEKKRVPPKKTRPARTVDARQVMEDHLAGLPPIGSSQKSDRERTLPFLYSLLLREHFNGDIGLSPHHGYARVRDICSGSFVVDAEGRWCLRERRVPVKA